MSNYKVSRLRDINQGATVFFGNWKGWGKTHTYTLKRFDYRKGFGMSKVAVLYSSKKQKLYYVSNNVKASHF